MTDNANLAALIGSRICHDLISPIGAINNGLELLTMAGETSGPEIDLIGESVGNAAARIRFFRIAFGAAGMQTVGRTEVTSILRDLYGQSRLKVSWTPEAAQSRAAVRLAFLGLLCLESAMPYGGMIEVNENDGAWALTGKADKLNVSEALWAGLSDPGNAKSVQPAHVQFALMPAIARDEGREISVDQDDMRIVLRF